ncbi:MAG: nucleotidyltransferase domain-containing protein [Bacteroidales bacterium]|nr:MAG: nucleotidyltransferase domain-containing protein [Bacteroidales bacterium]
MKQKSYYNASAGCYKIVRQYVANLNKGGVKIYKAYLFGSYARNQASDNSDIDVLLFR